MNIYQLKENEYIKVYGLLSEGIEYPEVLSIISHNNPGCIFVDNITTPKTGLVWSQGIKGFYFIGEEENENFLYSINDFIDTSIDPFLKKNGLDYFEFSGTTKKWEKQFIKIFKNRKYWTNNQQIFKWNIDTPIPILNQPIKYKILPVNEQITEYEIINRDFLNTHINLFWGDMNNFLSKGGKGYYALIQNKIIGITYSGFIYNNIHVIGIETTREYQRQGIAYNLGCKLVQILLEKNLCPYWECTQTNIASMKLAQKLGFKKANEYVCFGFKLSK